MRQLYLSAAHKSSGKTTLAIGLCAALVRRGLVVQPFKKGPDYIDPIWLRAAAGRPCYNLDFYTMEREEIRQLLEQRRQGADVVLIEGNKGLYDGLSVDGSDSNAALAELLETPVVLVIDSHGITRGIAPLLLGYLAFGKNLHITGVILNRVAGARHEAKLRQVIEHYTDLPLLGAVPNAPQIQIDERHLGLMPSNEMGEAGERIEALARLVEEQIDLERLLLASVERPALPIPPAAAVAPPAASLVIGYLADRAFGFYYPDDLERLVAAGAQLVAIDALHDPRLPAIDGLFIGGGFPETAMAELEQNCPLREAIRDFIERGGPTYAECGGLMYLSRSIRWQGREHAMVGVVQGDSVMHSRPQGRGYVRLLENGNAPWGRMRPAGEELAAHEFHYSTLENLQPGYRFAYRVVRGVGIDGRQDGILYKNLLANYAHLRAVGGNHWTARFVELVRRWRAQRQGEQIAVP